MAAVRERWVAMRDRHHHESADFMHRARNRRIALEAELGVERRQVLSRQFSEDQAFWRNNPSTTQRNIQQAQQQAKDSTSTPATPSPRLEAERQEGFHHDGGFAAAGSQQISPHRTGARPSTTSVLGHSTQQKPRVTKKKKTAKDPNRPKRPIPAFFRWRENNWDVLKAQYPTLKIPDVMEQLGKEWKELPELAKGPFVAQTAEAFKSWKLDIATYEARGGRDDVK
ncbi:hypothetical protein HBI81_244220 [Parastagonospora nodorum]|nr:hypothetical protein HBI73_239440 [Parastagonospora nodorum]KAH5620238.1 hypothetical protein HBI23_243140 [Parastagonospora nodorum]KAH5707474.1 hypothetical protein HBI18_249240 [Parastagonospora nodorum]KAH6511177.1 hypothetical protein HBI81_244220 [Parastagonospora nodorum]